MSKTFILCKKYPEDTFNPTITFGTNGIKIVYYDNTRRPCYQISILFDQIRSISEIIRRKAYGSFILYSSTIEEPKIINHDIKMTNNIDEVHKLINDGYRIACSKRDTILGIL